ncbi:hypothetical protein BDN71DRAFT_1402476, partial [Pleurotus eryngii]
GVFFTCTCGCCSRRTMKALLVPLICNMLSARQVAGLPRTVNAHYFCMTCNLDIDNINILDIKEWIMCDTQHVQCITELWKSARSADNRTTIFEAFGLHWTPLLKLQYWNPVKFIMIDTMYALDINLLKNHIRNLFHLNLKTKQGGDGSGPAKSTDKATNLNIKAICLAAKAIIACGKNIMQEIWMDMHNTQLLSWIFSVSCKWSTTSELSADQTYVLCTIHLLITLIQLWHNINNRMKVLLANFMDLINAIHVANMQTTSPGDVESYTTYMHRYMVKAQKLCKDEGIKPHQLAALHIGMMLEWFGPIHAHSTPYYKCYINFMHQTGNQVRHP